MERLVKIELATQFLEGACGVIWEMDMATQIQILDEAGCISHRIITLGKVMNYIILPMSK